MKALFFIMITYTHLFFPGCFSSNSSWLINDLTWSRKYRHVELSWGLIQGPVAELKECWNHHISRFCSHHFGFYYHHLHLLCVYFFNVTQVLPGRACVCLYMFSMQINKRNVLYFLCVLFILSLEPLAISNRIAIILKV